MWDAWVGTYKIVSLKHPKKNGKGLLFPIFCRKPQFALKVWENLEKKENTLVGFEPTQLSEQQNHVSASDKQATDTLLEKR